MNYSNELAKQICDRTACSSIGLRHICAELGVAYSTVTNWIYDEDHEFHAKYAKAKLIQLDYLAEEVLNIADDSSNDYMTVVKNGKECQVLNREAISRSNLRIRARLMLIAKLSPILRESKVKPKEQPSLKIGFVKIPPLAAEALSAKEGRQMPENDYGSSPKSQYEQPDDSPAPQGLASQLTDTNLKDARAREARENTADNIALRSVSSALIYPGSSPKNTTDNIALRSVSSALILEPAPAMQDQTSLSPDAILKDKKESESQENIGGYSPKNSSRTRHSDGEGGKTAPTERDPITPGFADYVARGGAPALYRR